MDLDELNVWLEVYAEVREEIDAALEERSKQK